MYNPPRFKIENKQEAFALMVNYPFATVVSVKENQPLISHLPLIPKWIDGDIELAGHMAKANPHWRILDSENTTLLFHGAHTFITPVWYEKDDVPTWNYSALHVSGQITLIEDYEGIVNCLKNLTDFTEEHWPSGWNFFIPEDLSGPLLTKHIVGFKILVKDINYKRKLSQNRSANEQKNIIKGLANRTDENSQKVRGDMLAQYKLSEGNMLK